MVEAALAHLQMLPDANPNGTSWFNMANSHVMCPRMDGNIKIVDDCSFFWSYALFHFVVSNCSSSLSNSKDGRVCGPCKGDLDNVKLFGQLVGLMIALNGSMRHVFTDLFYHLIVDPTMPFDPQHNTIDGAAAYIIFRNTVRAIIPPKKRHQGLDVFSLCAILEDGVSPAIDLLFIRRGVTRMPISSCRNIIGIQNDPIQLCRNGTNHNTIEVLENALREQCHKFWEILSELSKEAKRVDVYNVIIKQGDVCEWPIVVCQGATIDENFTISYTADPKTIYISLPYYTSDDIMKIKV